MSKLYRSSADKTHSDNAQFFRWWQHKHQQESVKTNENEADDYTDVHYIYDADNPYMNSTNSSFLSNHFWKKKLILGDIAARRGPTAQPITTVIVIASIFLFITMSVTAATVVFCKKKNTVFVLNKSEQEDLGSDYEMDELNNTDIEYADFGSELSLNRNKSAAPKAEVGIEETRRPLVERFDDNMDDTRYLVSDMPYRGRVLCENEQKGYRRLVVSAVVEKPGNPDSENEDSPYRIPNNLSKQKNKGFYRLTMMQSDIDSDCENSPARKKRVTNRRDAASTQKSCNCAESADIDWDNIKILTSRDGEELMLYEAKGDCECQGQKSRGQGHYKGRDDKRRSSDNFENIPLDNYVGDSAGRGRYKKVSSLVESPFHSHSKDGAGSDDPEVIVNRNVEDVEVTPPVKPVYQSSGPRIAGVSPTNRSNQRGNTRRTQNEACKVHRSRFDDGEDGETPGGRRRYVLYEIPRQRTQGTNTGITVSTQTGDDSNERDETPQKVVANCEGNTPPSGVGLTMKGSSSVQKNVSPKKSIVNSVNTSMSSAPPGGQSLNEIIIDPSMSSVQGVLPNAEKSSVLLQEVSPPAGRSDNQQTIFQDISCHSDICLSLMSPTDDGRSSPRQQVVQYSETASQNAAQLCPSSANNDRACAVDNSMSTADTVSQVGRDSVRSGVRCSRSIDNQSEFNALKPAAEEKARNGDGTKLGIQNVANTSQNIPPKIPLRQFELQFDDSFVPGHQVAVAASSFTPPIGQVMNHSPTSIFSPSQAYPIHSQVSPVGAVLTNRGPGVSSPTNGKAEDESMRHNAGVSPVTSPR